jgi:hypothetical protein
MSDLKMDVEYRATDGDSKDVARLMPFMSEGSSMVSREAENPSACVKAKAIKTLGINFMAPSSEF